MILSLPSIGVVAPVRLLTTDLPSRLALFSKGEIIEATVYKNLTNADVLLQIGDFTIPARTKLPLTDGARLTLRVMETAPQTILQIMMDVYPETEKTNAYLLLHRTNPQGLAETLTSLKGELMDIRANGTYPRELAPLIEALVTLMESLVMTPASVQNTDFVRNYVQGLGVLLEHSLFRSLENRDNLSETRRKEGLKGKLMRLLQDLETFLARIPPEDGEIVEKLISLQKQVDRAIQTIETHQVINVASREADNPFIIIIPMAFLGGVRSQEIYMEGGDGKGRDAAEGRTRRCVLCLDMDILGEMMVEISLTGDKLSCSITCRDDEARQAISALLDELRERLLAAGLKTEKLTCTADLRLSDKTKGFRSGLYINRRETISVFA